MFFEGDQHPLNPARYLPTPFHTKFAQDRTALSQYIQQESVGTRMRRWERLARSGEEIDLAREVGTVTMMTFQRTMLSSTVADSQVPALVELMHTQARYVSGLLGTFWAPRWLPVPGARRGVPVM